MPVVPPEEIYVSVDIETDGPIPGPHSMLALGAVALSLSKGELDSFSANLETLPGATMDPSTKVEFWDKQPKAWAACRSNPQPIPEVMGSFGAWVKRLPGKPVFVGYPVAFDFDFVHWYFMRYQGADPFGYEGLDIKSFAMAMLRVPWAKATRRSMPVDWLTSDSLTHVAVDDARAQGLMFLNMLNANLGLV